MERRGLSVISIGEQLSYWKRTKYRDANHPVTKAYVIPKVEFINKHIPLKDAYILDLACGNGSYTVEFSKYTKNVVGLDISFHMLSNNPANRLLMGNAESLPFGDNFFDIVFSANLLHHANNPMNIIREMKRVAKKYITIIEPNGINPIMFSFSLLVKAERGGLKSTKGRLIGLLEKCGLNILKTTTTGMISQNNTPEFIVPYLKRFDREIKVGEYIIIIAKLKS